jgi:hypothetical protein
MHHSLQRGVEEMQSAIAKMRSVQSSPTVEREFKSQKTDLGKGSPQRWMRHTGGSSQRAASMEPKRTADDSESGDPRKCHVLLTYDLELISSRVAKAVSQLVTSRMPSGVDFHVKARSTGAAITFSSAGDTSIFANGCFGKDESSSYLHQFSCSR